MAAGGKGLRSDKKGRGGEGLIDAWGSAQIGPGRSAGGLGNMWLGMGIGGAEVKQHVSV